MEVIEHLIASLDQAVSNKDIESIREIYATDACLVKQPGELARGIDEITAHYEALFALNIPLTITTEIVKSISVRSMVLVTSSWLMEGVDPEGNKGSVKKIANMVFVAADGDGWQLLVDNPFGPELLQIDNVQ